MPIIDGFSKLSRDQKIKAIAQISGIESTGIDLLRNINQDTNENSFLNSISENVISQFALPYSIVPNFNINGKIYYVPMVTEESSVVAAASSAAKFWFDKGGFEAKVISAIKTGQVHFLWTGNIENLTFIINELKILLRHSVSAIISNMEKRGGGIKKIELFDFTDKIPNYFQVKVSFETADAMGANFINTVLEEMSAALKQFIKNNFSGNESNCEIIMAILSNYNPDCLVECSVHCQIQKLIEISGDLNAADFARKFETAVSIANIDIHRATTHNKGIFNGIDAVVIATGNDFRSVEASGHAYAARDSYYKSLCNIEINNGIFKYSLKVPLAIGTVGGITSVHPLAQISLKILGNPSAKELMQIAASVGLANNFSAIRALISIGIQKGHMKLHLSNILKSFQANDYEKEIIIKYFINRIVSFSEVEIFIHELRNKTTNA